METEPLMIEISINGQPLSIAQRMTVQEILDTVEVPPNYLAVEINAEVVPREAYSARVVEAGDEIELVTLVGGG
jgi:sulfur carrier protein